MNSIIRVLVVDDSAFVRKVVREMLSRSPFLEVVGTAHNGEEALELVEQFHPDVVTLDLNMPRMSGLEFINKQMAIHPLPILVVSIASANGEEVIQALDAGAVDVVQKPTALANDRVLEISSDLIAKVKAAATARVHAPTSVPVLLDRSISRMPRDLQTDIVVIGASTGGPHALKQLIPRLPSDFPVPVAIVLHMPLGYTELFAKSLAKDSSLNVVEARDGEVLRPGLVMIAKAGQHLSFIRRADKTVIAVLKHHPLDTQHRPAVDVLFRSAAETYGSRTLGVVLSGMGCDGTAGAAWIKAQGGRVYTETEESCVVYGMPRAVAEAGLSDRSVSLDIMSEAIVGGL
jgi:two-component system chemotaxis response regulator CheB